MQEFKKISSIAETPTRGIEQGKFCVKKSTGTSGRRSTSMEKKAYPSTLRERRGEVDKGKEVKERGAEN